MRFLLLLLLAVPGFTQDLSATLRHWEREITADGLSRTTTYEETFQRRGHHLWRQRLLPLHRPASEHEGHGREIDLGIAAQHLERKPDGALLLEYLRPDLRTVVEVAPREWSEAGFDGSWPLAYHLVDPSHLATFTKRKGSQPGTAWYERRKEGHYIRVLWSDALKLALRLEEGREDGTRQYRLEVTLSSSKSMGRPWEHPSDWTRKDYTDLMD